MKYFVAAVEGDDWSESALFRHDSELALWVVILLKVLDSANLLNIILAEACQRQCRDQKPEGLAIVKNSVGLFMLFCDIEVVF